MEMTHVESSQIEAVGYDPQRRVLRVRFKKRAGDDAPSHNEYEYDSVPEVVHKDMMSADSVGSFFHKHVRNVFTTRKLERETHHG